MTMTGLVRRLTLTGTGVLMLGLALWHAWAGTNAFVILILIAPLFAPLPGLLRDRVYTHAWSSLLALAYLAYCLTEFVAAPVTWAAAPALLGALAMFIGCIAYVPLRARGG